MAEGWRNRLMAPVYALVVSFVLVFILGAVLNDPTPNDLTKIQFIAGQVGSGKSAKEVPDLHVRVETVAAKRQLAGVPLGRPREFTLLIPDEKIRICTKLPGWIAEKAKDWNPEVDGASGDSCWVGRATRGKDVMITLVLRER